MLSQVSSLPPNTKAGFHDYLTGAIYAQQQSAIVSYHPSSNKQNVAYNMFSSSCAAASPQDYLQKLILVHGKAVINSEGTIISSSGCCGARGTQAIREGTCWQFHAPISLNDISFGVCRVGQNTEIIKKVVSLTASTTRTVTLMMKKNAIHLWVNQSVPTKNNKIILEDIKYDWYPFIELSANGVTVVFNPFASQPNSSVSKYNPYNIIDNTINKPQLTVQKYEKCEKMLNIIQMKQLDRDRVILISDQNELKVVKRNSQNQKMQFPNIFCQNGVIYNLFSSHEWQGVKNFCQSLKIEVPELDFTSQSGLSIEEYSSLFRYLLIKIDSNQECRQNQQYLSVMYEISTKLAIFRTFAPKQIPNGLINCEIDRKQSQYSSQFFEKIGSQPARIIPQQLMANVNPWTKIDGKVVDILDITSHYLCAHVVSNTDEGDQDKIQVYHLGQWGIKKIFTQKILSNKLEFNKKNFLANFVDHQITSLWQSNNQGPQIYKILANCFNETNTKGDNYIFEVKEKDIKELVQDFNINKEEAITALQQCGDVEEALVWLAASDRKLTRKKKNKNAQMGDKIGQACSSLKISMVQLNEGYLISKILLQIDRSVYLLGYNPGQINNRFLKKTSKGFLNLSTFGFETSIKFVDNTPWFSSLNHQNLSILDCAQLPISEEHENTPISFIFMESKEIFVAYEEGGMLMRKKVKIRQDGLFNENSSLTFESQGEPLNQSEFIEASRVTRTINGQIFATVEQEGRIVNPSQIYNPNTAFHDHDYFYSNIRSLQKQQNQSNKIDMWIKFDRMPQLNFNAKEESKSSYLPLLVERGPPGCNLNYPICSILYPRSTQPFLANYPYSLTFKNLHSKYMRVQEVAIERIGAKKNVNEIKEGYVYFTNDSNIQSKKYHFIFNSAEAQQIIVKINESKYWKYMIIEPIYGVGKKLPYQIGFVGAKGTSIDIDQVEKVWMEQVEDSLILREGKTRISYTITGIQQVGDNVMKVSVKAPTCASNNQEFPYEIETKWNVIMKSIHVIENMENSQESVGQEGQIRLRTHQIVEMEPSQLVKILSKSLSMKEKGKNIIRMVMAEFSKNQDIIFSKYNSSQIRKVIDMMHFHSREEIPPQQFLKIYDKIMVQSEEGAKYLKDLLNDIGKGYYIMSPHFMKEIMSCYLFEKQKNYENILTQLLESVDKYRDKRYTLLQKHNKVSYLLFEKEYYSQYYYEKVMQAANRQKSISNIPCEEIYQENLIQNHLYIITREDYLRKITIKFSKIVSIRSLILRFDKTEIKSKAAIKAYAWSNGVRKLVGQTILHEHQWIQVTKNPYQQQMKDMFQHNQEWLNGFGLVLKERVQAAYLDIELLFTVTGIQAEQREANNLPLIDIIPEIYGQEVRQLDQSDLNNQLENQYFNIQEEQKFFIAKLPQHVQLAQQPNQDRPANTLNKYLINKQNIGAEYHYFQPSTIQSAIDNKEKYSLKVMQYFEQLQNFTENPSSNEEQQLSSLLSSYHEIMKNITLDHKIFKISRKPSLDYFYTAIMYMLEIAREKNVILSKEVCTKLLNFIIKKQIGPIALSALQTISFHPDILLSSLEYVQITAENQQPKNHLLTSISACSIKKNRQFQLQQQDIDKAINLGKPTIADSLINLITAIMPAQYVSIKNCIKLSKLAPHRHNQILSYILKIKSTLFTCEQAHKIDELVIKYLFSPDISEQICNQCFLNQISSQELAKLIIACRKLLLHDSTCLPELHPNTLITKLLSDSSLDQIPIDIVSFIFQLKLPLDEQWDHLSRCIKICPQAEQMIYCQYLSYTCEQKEQLTELVVFHSDILYASLRTPKNSQLFVGFLEELYNCDNHLFLNVVLGLPQDALSPLHEDIYSLIIQILDSHCNFGGIEGAKCLTFVENKWLSAVSILLKLSKKDIKVDLVNEEVQILVKWFLLNNTYEINMTNPVNRSPAVNLMKQVSEIVSSILEKANQACTINEILRKYSQIKEDIKKDQGKLISNKYLLLNRLQYGVGKLLQNSVDPKGLTELLAGKDSIFSTIVKDLAEETKDNQRGTTQKWEHFKDIDISEQFQGHMLHNQKLVTLAVKDWQNGKNGNKSVACKVNTSAKRVLLRPKQQKDINMHKFLIGFNIQENPDKNIILPDQVELYGSVKQIQGDISSAYPNSTIMQKICDLKPIEDQHYYQHSTKVFGINFNTLGRKYINKTFKALQIRMKSDVLSSCSDVLENSLKANKGSVYQISFLTVIAHEKQPMCQPPYGQIYMKLLSFLSDPRYNSTLVAVADAYRTDFNSIFCPLVAVLNDKSFQQSDDSLEIDNILSALSQQNLPILQELLKQKNVNNRLVKKILNDRLNISGIQLVLNDTLTHNFSENAVENIVESVRLSEYDPSTSQSQKIECEDKLWKIYQRYLKATKNIKFDEYIVGNKKDSEHLLLRRIMSSMMASTHIFKIPVTKMGQKIVESEQKEQSCQYFSYPVIASSCFNSQQLLEWLDSSGFAEKVAQNLITSMTEMKVNYSNSHLIKIYNCIYLLSSLVEYKPISQKLISFKGNFLPISIMTLLENQTSLLIPYPVPILKYFISFFQTTCTIPQQQQCAKQFADKLINLMTKIPQTSPQHHHYFIHDFFFPIINSFYGTGVSFVWTQNNRILPKVTQILQKFPIRKNQSIILENKKYFKKIVTKKQLTYALQDTANNNYLILYGKEKKQTAAEKVGGQWTIKSAQIKSISTDLSQVHLKVFLKNENQPKIVNESSTNYEIFIHCPSIVEELNNLLVNSTLQRVKKPYIFDKNYHSIQPAAVSMFDHLYYLPREMAVQDVLKQINISGFRIDMQAIKNKHISVSLNDSKKTKVKFQSKLQQLLHGNKGNSFLEFQIEAHDIFKGSTIQKMANQSDQSDKSKFIPQQTVFKHFQKLKGLQKMIKVMMTCVRNWKNVEQSKIWYQYLNELQSFSCFPVFSSIYMAKQDNVQLLFDILSGLPDKQDNKKWFEKQKKSVFFLYDIIKNVFEVEGEQATTIRNYAIKSGFYQTMLERLHLVTKQPKRHKIENQEEEEISIPINIEKKNSEEEYTKEIKKKKGIGYGTDSSSNQKWDITGHQQAQKQRAEQIVGLIKILQKFLSDPQFKVPQSLLNDTYESCLLPLLESSMRGGSLLQISKNADLFKAELNFIQALTKKDTLIPSLMDIPKNYEPKQSESIFSLIKTLEGTSRIFLSCLTGSVSEKTSQQIAKSIIETYGEVQKAISSYKSHHVDTEEEKRILELPLAKKYPLLMKDLRFDYFDMKDKNGTFKHHYSSSYKKNHTSPAAKTIRLAQQLADISHALPIDHTNAIYVRCDKERVDFMQALIMGSNGTPYGHGAYLFDIYFDDSYPNQPPKVNLTTTGSGQIRFNPNLYACGKVCLSLLGTWRGTAMENWDAKVSTLLQVLVSIQSIIMAEEVYFNEPGFEHEQGTVEGQKKNQAYSNIVRYGNIKFAMIDNLKNPPKGFETVIKRHFYLKKQEIMQQCKKWLKYAEKREASYTGLISDHNNNWCNKFKKSKTEYKTMLEQAIQELQGQLNQLEEPSSKDLTKQGDKNAEVHKKEKKVKIVEKDQNLEEIDVAYDKKDQGSNQAPNYKELDINDEKVKDRWSRYIGAMGIQAVSKQSKASILMFGLSSLGIEIAKNIVLSGCKKFTICDNELTTWNDLSGQFYLTEDDIGKSRVKSSLYKLQQLNNYVRVDSMDIDLTQLQPLKEYNVVISTTHSVSELIKLNDFCHSNGIKFISAKCEGPYGYTFNDFGDNFEVTDKNGEETVECMVQHISNAEEGIVTLLKGVRHPYEDGDVIRITKVKGMNSKTEEGKSINETVHKIKVINPFSFSIGNTLDYSEFQGNGLVRNMKLPITINFKKLQQSIKEVNIDQNLEFYDFSKCMNNRTLHHCFNTLSVYKEQNANNYPSPWNWEDSDKFLKIYKETMSQQKQLEDNEISYVRKFSFTCSGGFAPLCAFYGGLIAQEAFKAITSKYMPINQYFFTDFTQTIDQLPKESDKWEQIIGQKKYKREQNRFEGLRTIVGDEILKKIRECKVFVVGSGAIGCELLKNYAMINLATSDEEGKGEIVVTDPDHIESSNLNRQFLFREKHLQKPKSSTAAAAVKQMNRYLQGKNKIRAKLIKVCEATKDTFSNQFFEGMDIVTNALDNVQARQYIDLRCVQNKVALLESGTLSSKGHVQVIVPYKTETYGSKADPAEDGEIPHCTLKMFPEQTLHCVEWARDIFGKTFTMKPKALIKVLENLDGYNPTQAESGVLLDCLKMLQSKPANFDDAVFAATQQFYQLYRNDIKQLLYTYPLDAKTKDGKDFWKLPKRPPTPIDEINPQIPLHGEFITSYAVLMCKIFGIPYPNDFRTENRRKQIAKQAAKLKVPAFVPSDKLAQEMATQVEQKKEEDKQQEGEKNDSGEDYVQIFKQIKLLVEEEKEMGNVIKVIAQQFQKDEDGNGHIDLIYSMANLRASNYKLDPMDWITTKLKAGRITPALSTTTSCIAALQTIQLIKYLKNLPVDLMKNSFLNLAVPMIQTGQPGEIQKIKIHEDLTTTIWERWSLDAIDYKTITMGEIIAKIEDKFKISVKNLGVAEGGPIFSDLVLGLESKKKEKQEFMLRKLKQVLNEQGTWQEGKNFVDLTLVMALGQQFIKHVPTLRVTFTQ